MRRAIPVLLALGALLLPAVAGAQVTKVAIESPLLPLARPGAWTPIHVDIAATEPLEGQIRVDFGTSAAPAAVRAFSVGRGSAKRIVIPVLTPSWVREVNVVVTRGRSRILATKSLVQSTGQSSSDALHVVVIGEDPLGFPMLRDVAGVPVIGHPDCTEPRAVRVETLLPAQLPDTWFGWTAADLIVWKRPDPARLTPEQQSALTGWVISGGTLLVALGDTWRAWDGSPLGSLSGATPSPIAPTTAIFGRLAFATGVDFSDLGDPVPAVALTPMSATPRLWADEAMTQPLLVDRRVGAGRVVTMGWDPAAGELRGRLVREDVWRELLDLPASDRGEDDSVGERARKPAIAGPPFPAGAVQGNCGDSGEWGGGETMTAQRAAWRGQLEGTLSTFQRANPLPLGFVLVFGVVYLLLIGPVDYFVLRRLKRPMLTWLTFPALAIGFSLGAAALITFQKTGNTEVRCAEVVDLFPGQQMARGSAWCAMWSSRRQDVVVQPGRGAGVVAPGGSSATEDALSSGELRHQLEPTRAGLSFRAAQWAVTTWRAGWVDTLPGGLAVTVGDGEVLVSNRTGIDLENVRIVLQGDTWQVGSLPDGDVAVVKASGAPWSSDLLGESPSGDALWEWIWSDAWRQLDTPWDEHVAPLHTHHRDVPVLIGMAQGGVAPPSPVDSDFVVSSHAMVRVLLPALDPEVLP